nr:uncharacterized protein LOC105966667 [Ipomoea batatas]
MAIPWSTTGSENPNLGSKLERIRKEALGVGFDEGWKRERSRSGSPEKKSSSRVPTRVDAGEERFEGRIAVDEGGEEVGPVVNVGAEDEDERGEEEEEEEMGNEDGGGVLEELGGGVVVDCR